ncbi:hypothetical protein [Phyllobacterium myrsinacearum]|uniref:Uncharacterized protein n=1 Tax=Phyllobacterium myrsinacearum TaxID=28101 RepID=A0A839EH55_9HYPH|nr:hypothetical protein [Phyllobacterium myrsinacearum]MBA8876796.1 hypothetical protein [Phyllobacterium myrsinacearum]
MLAHQAEIIDLGAYRQAKTNVPQAEQPKQQSATSYPMFPFAWIAMPISFVPVVFYTPFPHEAHS